MVVTNYLLTGMILQATPWRLVFSAPKRPPGKWHAHSRWMPGNRFSFRTRSGDLGCPTGSITTGKTRWFFFTWLENSPFSIRESAPKRRVFLVGESPPLNSDLIVVFVWWFCCYPDWVFHGMSFSPLLLCQNFGFPIFWGHFFLQHFLTRKS